MGFDHDIFISYAHIDNETPLEGQEGWVSSFHRALEVRVGQLLGQRPQIWRDPKLQGNDLFADTLVEKLPKVALLVSVLTPRYVQSEWCVREMQEFLKASEHTGGLRVADKSRLFKVLKTPTPPERHPPEVQPLLGYEFFKTDPETGRVRELDQMFGPEAQREFWARLDDLAHDIAELLERMAADSAQHAVADSVAEARPVAMASKGAVYLAATTVDLKDQHDNLRRDLQRHGFTVLPDRSLPLIAQQFDAVVREELARCRMSIHLVGRNYGIVPEGATESMVVLQNELAMERASSSEFSRLVWIPSDLVTEDERQQQFIERLRTDSRMQAGADLLETPLEDLKTVIHEQLEPPRKTEKPRAEAAATTGGENELTRLYLICDQRDQEAVAELESYLFDQGLEVTLPAFEGDEAEVRGDHEENLHACDAVLIYYGAANDLWLRRKLRELQKIAGYGRTKPMLGRAICVALPATSQKERLRTREARLIAQPTGFAAEPLQPFLEEIRAGKQRPTG